LVGEVLKPPYHPYTEALLSAVPIPGARKTQRVRLAGDPGATATGPGCCFAARCPRKLGTICDALPPPKQQPSPTHYIACHIPQTELAAVKAML
jgi:peptide/nickel transport system ATP-binding protein